MVAPEDAAFLSARVVQSAIDGLKTIPRSLPIPLLFDARGVALYDKIVSLPSYYLRDAEIALLDQYARQIAKIVGPVASFVDYGGSSLGKADRLLAALDPRCYVPVDVAAEALQEIEQGWQNDAILIAPKVADFLEPHVLPHQAEAPFFALCAGTTLGNYEPDIVRAGLANMKTALGPGAHLLIGMDCTQDAERLLPAYNDPEGYSAAFAKNGLYRLRTEVGANFKLGAFDYDVTWVPNGEFARVEMSLVSKRRQTVTIKTDVFEFQAGEKIRIARSYKYYADEFRFLTTQAGWEQIGYWRHPQINYALFLLRC